MGFLKWETIVAKYTEAGFSILGEPQKLRPHDPLQAKCKNGHELKLRWNGFKQGDGCKLCTQERKRQEHLVQIINSFRSEGYELINGKYEDNYSKLELKCPSGHIWSTKWANWRQGNRCGICNGHNKQEFSEIKESIESEIGYKVASKSSDDIKATSKIKVICPNGHQFTTTYRHWKNRGQRCRKCHIDNNVKWDLNEIKEIMLHDGYTVISAQYIDTQSKMEFVCDKGHKYISTWESFSRGHRCHRCGINKPHRELIEFFELYKLSPVINDRSVLDQLELDLYFPEQKIAIEYCGLYWHSEKWLNSSYHLNKLNKCTNLGIRLFTIFEDEWLEKKEIIKSILLSKFGIGIKINARDTEVKVPTKTEATNFLIQHHLNGRITFNKAWGLFQNNSLVMLMTFGKHHRQSNEYLLNRLCTKSGYNVVGGASRLWSYASKEISEVITFADRRYSEGGIYEKLGFQLVNTLMPDYSYIKNFKRFSKQSLRKPKNVNITEKELRKSEGYLRIYDCGKHKYKKVVSL